MPCSFFPEAINHKSFTNKFSKTGLFVKRPSISPESGGMRPNVIDFVSAVFPERHRRQNFRNELQERKISSSSLALYLMSYILSSVFGFDLDRFWIGFNSASALRSMFGSNIASIDLR